MKIVVGLLLLIANALAYPVAESDSKVPEVPLVITDYSSVAKAEDRPAHDVSHGAVTGHVHDSAESLSSSSSESNENKSVEAEKPKDEIKSSESSEEGGILHDALPISTLKPEKIEEKINLTPKPELNKEAKKEELKKEEPLKELKEEKKEEAKPLLKPTEAPKPIEKMEEKAETIAAAPASEPIPAVRSGDIAPKKTEEIEKPIALPAMKSDLPASRSDLVQPSEQKVEVLPAAEEIKPKVKSAEKIPQIDKDVKVEKKERAENEKPAEKKVEINNKQDIPSIKSGQVLNVKSEEKKPLEPVSVIKPVESSPSAKTLPEEKRIAPETPKEKIISPEVKLPEELPKVEEKPKAEEPKLVTKSLPVEEIKPEEKKPVESAPSS